MRSALNRFRSSRKRRFGSSSFYMIVPNSWVRLKSQFYKDEGFIEFKAPCGPRKSADLSSLYPRAKEGLSVSLGNSHESFEYDGKRWWRYFRKRDTAFNPPDRFLCVYGLISSPGLVICRCPGTGIPWRKTLLPALNKVAREHGASFYANDKGTLLRAYVEGTEETVWNNGNFERYQWDGFTDSFKKVP